ncbi:MAG TPA: fasciclin domain-containing protein [Phnomibacter sp.]|nr:fasciclin domain-containing protein [Phnomibacter sp.]
MKAFAKPKMNFFFLFALAMVTLVGCKKEDNNTPPSTIVDVLSNNGFSTLTSLAVSANLGGTLTSTGPFTLFAPSNDAFNGVTAPTGDALTNLLTYHVIGGAGLSASDVVGLSNGNLISVTMANGDSVFVRASSNGVFVNGIQVNQADLRADNGIVHGIGRILFPPTGNIVETAINTPGFDSLVKAVVQVSGAGTTGMDNIAQVLSTLNGVTVFAPTNDAFAALFANQSFPFRSISEIPNDVLRTVLLHHAVTSRAFSNDLQNGTIAMANGSSITVSGVGTNNIILAGSGTVFTNTGAGIPATNIMARNGVIHVIDRVLIP